MTTVWRIVQVTSGLAMSAFTTLHIGNTLTAAISQELYDSTMASALLLSLVGVCVCVCVCVCMGVLLCVCM